MGRSYNPALSMFLWYKSSLISVVDNLSNASEFITKNVWVRMFETLNLCGPIKRALEEEKWNINNGNNEMNLKGLFYTYFVWYYALQGIFVYHYFRIEFCFEFVAVIIYIVLSVQIDCKIWNIFYLALLSRGYAKKHCRITLNSNWAFIL